MVEYSVHVNNKFFVADNSEDEAEDPSVLLQLADVKKDDKTPAQKKADKKAEKLKKEKAAAQAKELEAKKAAAAAKPAAGKENARPEGGRGRGRGGPRGAGGERRPPREVTEGGERQFNGEGRGRGRGRGGARGAFRGGRGGNTSGGEEQREVTFDESAKDGEVQPAGDRPAHFGRGRGRGRGGYGGDRPPRDFTERSAEQGDRPRGGGRGRGRFGDRQSGSDRTGVKSVDSKGGYGKANWGTAQDEIAASENPEAEKSEEEAPVEQPPREKTAEEIAAEEEEARLAAQKTLAEFRAAQKKEEAKFNLRKAGEGADEKAFGKLVPLQKKQIEDEVTVVEEVVEVLKKEPRNKQIIVDFKFNDSNRGGDFGGRGRGGDRGRRGGAGGRGGRGGRGGSGATRAHNEPFRVAEEAFPALGKA